MRIRKENNYQKFLGSLIKKGNKVAAKRILTESFLDISKKKKIPVYKILNKVFSRLENYVEIKKIPWGKKKKKTVTLIPFPVKPKRQNFIKVKWILESAKEDTKKVNFSTKLSSEMYNLLYDKKKSKALAKKKEVRKLVIANKSNSHFRW